MVQRTNRRVGLACLAWLALLAVPVGARGQMDLGIPTPIARFRGRGVGTWTDHLGASDRARRREAFTTLYTAGEEAVPMLVALLGSSRSDVRERATAALSRIGPCAVPYLVVCLADHRMVVRYHAVCVLRNLGRGAGDTARFVARLLRDESALVSMEAARALAMMHERAAPAVDRLAAALTGRRRETRVMAAGALASIGAHAAPACKALIRALDDQVPAVRRCAADALAAIGREAAPAVARLTASLRDPDLHVRVSAAGALGCIGPTAAAALPSLRRARSTPGLAAEASWAIRQITGEKNDAESRQDYVHPPTVVLGATRPQPGEWPTLGGSASRNAVSSDEVPAVWDLGRRRNILWSARLGNETYGSPIVAGGRVYVGTGNESPRDRRVKGKRGVLMAFRARDGRFLWQDVTSCPRRGRDLLLPVTSSSPLVEGDRLFYVTAQAELRCLDTEGFHDDENDGPIVDERATSSGDADLVWELDFVDALGVFPHEAPNCSVVSVGNLLMVCTSNGVDEAHTNIPAPRAPSFLGVDKQTGAIAWQVVGPSPRVLHGQWSSPAALVVNGRSQVVFGGGDGWLYALETTSGREIWRFRGNPRYAVWRTGGDIEGVISRNNIIACPVVHDGVVYLAMGQDPAHGQGQGRLYAIDPGGHGDVTRRRRLWENTDVGRVIACPIVDQGLVYVADYNGEVHCIDAATGTRLWVHDLLAGVWGAALLANDKLYVGDEDGMMTVFRAGPQKKVLATMDMDAPIWSVPSVADGVLYVSTARRLVAIAQRRR